MIFRDEMRTVAGDFDHRSNGFVPGIGGHPLGPDSTPTDTEKVIELYGTLQAPLRAYLGTFCLSADEADDVIQEVFVRLMRHLRGHGNGSKPGRCWDENHRGWVFRVAHNFVMDIYRNGQRVAHVSHHDAESLLSHRADPALDPEQAFLSKERLTRLDTALAKLNIEQRNCLQLRANGLRHKEIGTELGISAQQAAKLLQQGLGLLATELRNLSPL